ncbi:IclR family transcriptional regulator [Thalassospira profundimaris]|uniref:IclR family transcriptional regulator n=1 Tax=Thalassospira profundimaris TaxID=502049 RepID=A0A367XDB8_9PROT|nr:IclR family transcriptional regulator [Thalassospira profundimaris]RCK50781.1 IclR family transcriptional regulator [Thalassospira profundimaris]
MAETEAANTGATAVPALRRAVAIMDYVSQTSKQPNAAEIGRVLSLPKSTLHGLLLAMIELGLLTRGADGTFSAGPHPMRWANGFLAQNDLVEVFKTYFAETRDFTQYTITMTVLDGNKVVYIACSNANLPLGVTFRIGMRLPAAFTATGKALLAELDPVTLKDLFASRFPDPLTSRSVRNPGELARDLEETRQRGFSIDDGQVREGMICLGTALHNHTGDAVAGLAISLTRSEATAKAIADLGGKLVNAGREISRRLGA